MVLDTHTVCATFTFNSAESKSKFLDILNGNDGLVKTREFSGCQMIECYESVSNDNQVVIWQKWNKQSDHAAYLKMRQDSGMFDVLNTLLESPLDVQHLARLPNL